MLQFIRTTIAIQLAALALAVDAVTYVASTTYPIPTALNPVKQYTVPYNAGTMSRSVSVKATTVLGPITDPSNGYSVFRDNGGSCTLGNRTFFTFADANAYVGGTWKTFKSAQSSFVTDFDTPEDMEDYTMSTESGAFQAIPFTSAESAVSGSPSKRIAMWTWTNCIPLSSKKAMHFYSVQQFTTSSHSYSLGNTMAVYTLTSTTDPTIDITRASQIFFPNTTYGYGTFASVVVNDTIYLYGVDSLYSGNYDVHVARVSKTAASDITSYQYYDAGTATWGSTMPVPTARRQSAATVKGNMPFSTGTVYYSEYHNQYLMVFFNNWIDNKLRYNTAPTPLGPWTTSNQVLWVTPSGASYNYRAVAHPLIYASPGSTIGQKIAVHYSYQNGTFTYPMMGTVEFQ
ncbi:uncharacterized protein V1516DRAFT_113655 [Lipomyces oligophaga]|uniref:uncharacterized protein n=1 Tax=Lipomyces oligophaga TaxID=45792 RepID=UPI0034CF3DDD